MKKALLSLGILAVGVAAFLLLRSMHQPPQRLEQPYHGPLVKAITAPAQSLQVVVEGQGTVRSDAQIDLVPQVSGVVVWKSPDFEPGGAFAKEDLLFQIDPRDYELAVDQAEAAVAQASYRLDLAREESAVARLEWERFHPEGEAPGALVLRLPQLKAAEADLQAARARLEETRLRLERTRLYAPFDGRLHSARAEIGQHLVAGQPAAQLYSIEKAEIVVSVPDEDLAWFELPLPVTVEQVPEENAQSVVYDSRSDQLRSSFVFSRQAAAAVVSGSFAGHRHQWTGHVVRTEGGLDPQSRMTRLVVEVEAPYGGIGQGRPPLTVGMFVDVAIAGRRVDGVRVLPRSALHQGDRVWVVGADGGILHVRPAEVVRRMKEEVLVYVDMAADERVVVSQLRGVTDGMKVRLASNGEEAGS